jgi:type IV pilus assembly protein PilN
LFATVDLKRSQTKVFDDNIRLKEFEISCTKKSPEQTDSDKKSSKRKK